MDPVLRERLLRLNADLATGDLKPDVAVFLACDLLVAGLDTPALAELAGEPADLAKPKAESLVIQVLAELGVERMTARHAAWLLARDVAHEVISGRLRREIGVNRMYVLGLWHGVTELKFVEPEDVPGLAAAHLTAW
ncbi:hypothetical protein ABZX92_08725 [Lentzea sp. NPDC006480]|uniref:hypothetical protein n=1 Tax=Lentzea sp. NPDC006480 TaxID=3157176 RepID=UPI0033B1410F